MSEKEILDLQDKIDQGLQLAERRMLEEKALHGQDVIICTDGDNIQRISAKQAMSSLAM
ncbi:MAG: ribosome recycling factor [bacterium]